MKSIVFGVMAVSVLAASTSYASVMREDPSANATSVIVEKLTDGTLVSDAKALYHQISQPAVKKSMPANPPTVPEPGTLVLIGAGLAGMRLLRRKSK